MAQDERPKPGQFPEISQGSGPAAILLFLHIAVTGYLGFVVYYLLMNNTHVFWNLFPFSAALFFYFPAAFAIITPMPTDKLTKVVGWIARTTGLIAVIVYGIGLIPRDLGVNNGVSRPTLITACAIAAGLAGGLLARLVFGLGIRGGSGFSQKNDQRNITS